MSASRKPQVGEPVALSANALADAYRAADIVLGKDGGFSAGKHDFARHHCITLIYNAPTTYESFFAGQAIPFGNLSFGDNYSPTNNEQDLTRFCSKPNEYIHRANYYNDQHDNKQFGIIRQATKQSGKKWIFKLQVKGLVYVRCVLFADAWAVGPPVQTYDSTYGRKYPAGNYYGSVPIISKGRWAEFTTGDDYPRIQECLIDLG